MQTIVVLLVVTLLVIAGAATLAPKLRIPAPLILVLAGIVVSLIPAIPSFVLDPHIILLGMLPALLYASARSIPAMNFRREFNAINGLSIVLIVLSSLALGLLFHRYIPGLPFGWGVALGAIISPTDAVATTMIKGRGVPNRVSVMLEGEGLLNDATALIMLRTAIVATSLGFSFWPTIGNFAMSVGVAVVIGTLAAIVNLSLRRHVRDEAVNTILSFTVPYFAAVPTELLHGSGLVAAVVAGFVVGAKAPRVLPPMYRVSDMHNWATIELSLEGVIFLTMGLQLSVIVKDVANEPSGIQRGVIIALLALALTLVVRALYVIPLLRNLNMRALRLAKRKPKIAAMQTELEAGRVPDAMAQRVMRRGRPIGENVLQRLITNGRRHLADLDYLAAQPLHAAEMTIIVWAGMRGAVTVAAAQLLPPETPHRSLLVFIAFTVATVSLIVQGGSIGFVAARLFPASESESTIAARNEEGGRIQALLSDVTARVERAKGVDGRGHRLAVLSAQRNALLDARDDGIFGAEALALALRDVDIDEMVLDLRSGVAEAL